MRNQIITTINEQLTTATENYTSTNDRVLDAVVDANRKVVDFAVKTLDSVNDLVEVPTVDVPFADRLPSVDFPTPAEAGKRYIDFVERAADLNRDFSERIIDMIKVEEVKPVAKKTAAKKPAAKKTAARKPAAKKAAAKK